MVNDWWPTVQPGLALTPEAPDGRDREYVQSNRETEREFRRRLNLNKEAAPVGSRSASGV